MFDYSGFTDEELDVEISRLYLYKRDGIWYEKPPIGTSDYTQSLDEAWSLVRTLPEYIFIYLCKIRDTDIIRLIDTRDTAMMDSKIEIVSNNVPRAITEAVAMYLREVRDAS